MSQTLDYLLKLTDSFSGPMARARSEQGRFMADGKSGLGGMTGAWGGLVAKVGAGVAALGLATAAWKGLSKAVSGAADMESTKVALETLIGDVETAGQLIKDFKKLGADTPFEFPDLIGAGKTLISFGGSASTAVEEVRMLSDVASGTTQAIGELALVYGKAKVAQTLMWEDIDIMIGRGLPVLTEFGKQMGVDAGEVKKLASEGKITFPMLERMMKDLTSEGGKYYQMSARQGKTMNGLWSTLKDNIGEIFTTLGTPVNDGLKPMLQSAIGMAGTLSSVLSSAIAKGQVGEALSNALSLGAKTGINAVIGFIQSLPSRAASAMGALAEAMAAALTGSFDQMKSILSSWKPDAMRFDTSKEMEFFKRLTQETEKAGKATDGLKNSVKEAAAAANAPLASAGGSTGRGDERYDENGRRRSDGRRKIIGARGDGRADFQGIDGFRRMQLKDEVKFNEIGKDGYGRGQAVHRFSSSNAGAAGGMRGGYGASTTGRTAPRASSLDAFHAKNGTQGFRTPFAPNLPSPGLAKRDQERRETAATASRSAGGTHPLAAEIKAIAAKLNSLAVAS